MLSAPLKHWRLDSSYQTLPDIYYSSQQPATVSNPQLILFNKSLAHSLGIDVGDATEQQLAALFAGQTLPDHSKPIAQAYAGHQFGHFTMLGDGRAILLGEHLTADHHRFDIQLKGSGVTPYSRRGDGQAALGPMLREYIISEALHGLKIATTRSLAVVSSGETVYRESPLPGAILTRVAASHLRVGTFQYGANWGTREQLQQLIDYAIWRHDETLLALPPYERNIGFLEAVIERQCRLVANWQLVGFIHGVMNTDNMTISGETIDYGPCAFMDIYHPDTVFSSIDSAGRYAYKNQPNIALWNLTRLAEAILPLLDDEEQVAIAKAEDRLYPFVERFHQLWEAGMLQKLGITKITSEASQLYTVLLDWMETYKADFTNIFRLLTLSKHPQEQMISQALCSADLDQWVLAMVNNAVWHEAEICAIDLPAAFQLWSSWYEQWEQQLALEDAGAEAICKQMQQVNPAIIARNHIVEQVLREVTEEQNDERLHRLLTELEHPFVYNAEKLPFTQLPNQREAPYYTFCGT